ncbi:MAG: DUF2254 family protein [Anaerolineales bacterium]
MQLQKLWSNLKSSLWFRPTLWVVAFVLLAFGLTAVDRQWSPAAGSLARGWFLTGGVQGARTMLGSIASAMLTVTSLTFSIMMVAVVQTANTYSPRILRQYLGDSANQHVLGILMGTFLFTLLALRGVRDHDNFVPLIATNFALLLSLLSIGALIYFINHPHLLPQGGARGSSRADPALHQRGRGRPEPSDRGLRRDGPGAGERRPPRDAVGLRK